MFVLNIEKAGNVGMVVNSTKSQNDNTKNKDGTLRKNRGDRSNWWTECIELKKEVLIIMTMTQSKHSLVEKQMVIFKYA